MKTRDLAAVQKVHHDIAPYHLDWKDSAVWRIAWGGELIYLAALIVTLTEPRSSQSVFVRRAR